MDSEKQTSEKKQKNKCSEKNFKIWVQNVPRTEKDEVLLLDKPRVKVTNTQRMTQ